jgi:hypothetical protein
MEDLGFNGSGSHFNSRFEAGAPIQAKQLNDLAAGIQASLPIPYLGEGPSVSFTPGGSVITDSRTRLQPGQPAGTIVQQYQMRSVVVDGNARLQIAKGTVSFTQSNMPRVRQGGHNDQRQGWISKVAVYGSDVTLTAGQGDPLWMDGNGYYSFASGGTYYVTISKFDINQSNDDTENALLNAEAPWVSIFKAGDDIEDIIFSETGPSLYVNKTNVQKMVGYDAMSTGLQGDWGNCHTTWFNPVKWGYGLKLIGIVYAEAVVGEGMRLTLDQHIVGPIDLQIPVLFNGTTLCNQDDLTETNDPYNLNKDSTPKWSMMANADTLNGMNSLAEANDDWYEEFVGPADWTEQNYDYKLPGSCAAQDDGEVCIHPFYTYPRILKPDPNDPFTWLYRANVCGGMVNNLIPWNREGPTKQKLPTTIDFLPLLGTVHIYIRLGTEAYDSNNPVFPVTDDTDEYYPVLVQYPANTPEEIEALPVDTDEYCYMLMAVARNVGDPENFIIDQMVSGSLWVDRIKMGTQTARYYWARI